MAEIRDFTKKRDDVTFRIDDDVFHAARGVPAEVLMDFATQFSGMSLATPVDEQLKAFRGVFELVLLPKSLQRFTARMRDRENPIEIDQCEQVITWLMEQYGLRPTELPSSSLDGPQSPATGTTSTVSTPDAELISAVSPSIGS